MTAATNALTRLFRLHYKGSFVYFFPLVARALDEITFVDLYAEYPRFDIDIAKEQQRLLDQGVLPLPRQAGQRDQPLLVSR